MVGATQPRLWRQKRKRRQAIMRAEHGHRARHVWPAMLHRGRPSRRRGLQGQALCNRRQQLCYPSYAMDPEPAALSPVRPTLPHHRQPAPRAAPRQTGAQASRPQSCGQPTHTLPPARHRLLFRLQRFRRGALQDVCRDSSSEHRANKDFTELQMDMFL